MKALKALKSWILQWFKSSGRLNILSAAASLAICVFVGRWLLASTENWHKGVGQSLVAAAAVSFVALATAIAQYLFVTRPYEAIVSLGIRRFRQRGSPGSRWEKQLRGVQKVLTFFGKDHNKLVTTPEKQDLLRGLVLNNSVTITFYLLAEGDDYYREDATKEEIEERKAAAKAMFVLRASIESIDPDAARRLLLFQYKGRPTFACTWLDQTMIFGPYITDLENKKTPEFEIEPGEDTWLYDACREAFNAAIAPARVSPLLEPTADPPAVAHTDGKEQRP